MPTPGWRTAMKCNIPGTSVPRKQGRPKAAGDSPGCTPTPGRRTAMKCNVPETSVPQKQGRQKAGGDSPGCMLTRGRRTARKCNIPGTSVPQKQGRPKAGGEGPGCMPTPGRRTTMKCKVPGRSVPRKQGRPKAAGDGPGCMPTPSRRTTMKCNVPGTSVPRKQKGPKAGGDGPGCMPTPGRRTTMKCKVPGRSVPRKQGRLKAAGDGPGCTPTPSRRTAMKCNIPGTSVPRKQGRPKAAGDGLGCTLTPGRRTAMNCERPRPAVPLKRGRPRKAAGDGTGFIPTSGPQTSSWHLKSGDNGPAKRFRPSEHTIESLNLSRSTSPAVGSVDDSDPEHGLKWVSTRHHVPVFPEFTAPVGILVDVSNYKPVDFFGLYLTDTLLQTMAEETNRYAQQYVASRPNLTIHARARLWVPTDSKELKKFFGLTFAMGLVKKPSIESYWSSHPLLSTPLYPATMCRNRYQLILRFLHVADNDSALPKTHPRHDPLYKVRPLLCQLSKSFKEVYSPSKNISVDESLLLYKGRVHFRQYIPMKRSKYGIKLFKLCESSTGYTLFVQVYVGKGSQSDVPDCPPSLNKTETIVWDLVRPLLNSGYHLYMDNYFTGIPLFQCLAAEGTLACGTIRKNRKGFPHELLSQKSKKGTTSYLCCKELLALCFSDRRDVFMLSTIHDTSAVEVDVPRQSAPVIKPRCVQDYNQYMGGVDRSDQMLHTYNATRKSTAWYKKLVIHLLQLSLHNSFVLYQQSAATPSMSFLRYHIAVVASLLFGSEGVQETENFESFVRLTERHFPRKVEATIHKSNAQKRCRVCFRRGARKDTRYCCTACPSQPGLCVIGCFEQYHSKLHYWNS